MSKKALTLVDFNENSYGIFSDHFATNKIKGTRFSEKLVDKKNNEKKSGITFPKGNLELLETVNSEVKKNGGYILNYLGEKLTKEKIKEIISNFVPNVSPKASPRKNTASPVAKSSDDSSLIIVNKELLFEDLELTEEEEKQEKEGLLVKKKTEITRLEEEFTEEEKEQLKGFQIEKTKVQIFNEMKASEIKIISEMKSHASQSDLEIEKMKILEFRNKYINVYYCSYFFNEYDMLEFEEKSKAEKTTNKNDKERDYDKIIFIFSGDLVTCFRFCLHENYQIKTSRGKIYDAFFDDFDFYEKIRSIVVNPEKRTGDLITEFIFRMESGLSKPGDTIKNLNQKDDYFSKMNIVVSKRHHTTSQNYAFEKYLAWVTGFVNLNKFEDDFLMGLYERYWINEHLQDKQFITSFMEIEIIEKCLKREKNNFGYLIIAKEKSNKTSPIRRITTKSEKAEIERLRFLMEQNEATLTQKQKERKKVLFEKYEHQMQDDEF